MPVADKRYYVSNDRTRVVEEGDDDAGALLAAEGDEISDADLKKYGIKFGQSEADKAEDSNATKAQRAGSNKAEQPADDKGAA